MTNQAAQTMPLPEPFQKAVIANRINTMAVRQGYEVGGYEKSPDLYTADQMHQYARDYAAALSQTAGVPSWIVNDLGELGVMVNGVAYFLYKGDNIVYEDAKHDDGSPMLYRMVGKREFGEVCRPRHWEENGWAATHRYTQELVYTPGLSFGKPEDGDWRPLPAQAAAPAASGGECNCASGRGAEHCIVHAHAAWDAPQPPSAASVSERARALLADEYERNGHLERAAIVGGQALHPDSLDAIHLRAIEQALTQQRGCATCGGRGEIGGHVGQTAETFDYVTEPCPECTTPQPSADAVRELAATWRKRAERKRFVGLKNEALLDEAHADELESLLSAASGEKGVG